MNDSKKKDTPSILYEAHLQRHNTPFEYKNANFILECVCCIVYLFDNYF